MTVIQTDYFLTISCPLFGFVLAGGPAGGGGEGGAGIEADRL